MTVDTIIEDPRWEEAGLEALADHACGAVLAHVGLGGDWEISLMGCDDARIADLNRDFRGKPAPTNVLSWPSEERGAEEPGVRPDLPEADFPDMPGELGDIAIAWDTCVREAGEADKSLNDHVLHLLVHATLHLLGYDHIREEDAHLMEGTEVEILATMGIADPYN